MDNQLTRKTEEENNRIRAAVLKDLNWDIDPNSELFPLVKMYMMGASSNDAKMKQLAAMISHLDRKIEDAKEVGGLSRSGWEIFFHGFGRWGFVSCFAILVTAVVFVHVYDNSAAQVIIPSGVKVTYQSTATPVKQHRPKKATLKRRHVTDSTSGN